MFLPRRQHRAHLQRALRTLPWLATALTCVLLAACATPPPAPVEDRSARPAPVARAPQQPVQVDPTLRAALDAAWQALAEDRLVVPVDNNAYDGFRAVLRRQPGHPEALRGLEQVLNRYLDLARGALARGDRAAAELMLTRAELVNPEHPGLADLHDRLDALLAAPDRSLLALDPGALRARSARLAEDLRRLASEAKAQGQPVLITAPSDADGRWIYQQMNAVPGARLRANLELGSPPRVRLQPAPTG